MIPPAILCMCLLSAHSIECPIGVNQITNPDGDKNITIMMNVYDWLQSEQSSSVSNELSLPETLMILDNDHKTIFRFDSLPKNDDLNCEKPMS